MVAIACLCLSACTSVPAFAFELGPCLRTVWMDGPDVSLTNAEAKVITSAIVTHTVYPDSGGFGVKLTGEFGASSDQQVAGAWIGANVWGPFSFSGGLDTRALFGKTGIGWSVNGALEDGGLGRVEIRYSRFGGDNAVSIGGTLTL